MKKAGKILAMAVACSMAISAVGWPLGRKNIQAEVFETFEYKLLTDTTVEITGYQGTEGVLVIPKTIDGKTVTGIGDGAFKEQEQLTEVQLPDSITRIGDEAFDGCTNLTEINLVDGLATIGSYAFRYCRSLADFELPNSLTDIGEYAFGSVAVTEITIPGTVTNIKSAVFAACKELTEVNISEGVTQIGMNAFVQCSGITEVSIPNTVTEIGLYAFQNCTSLTDVSISESVTTIQDAAFRYCTSLANVYYAGTEEQWNRIQIGKENDPLLQADIYCEGDLTDGTEDVYDYRVLEDDTVEITGYRGTEEVLVIPKTIDGKTVTGIGDSAFKGQEQLTEVQLTDSITRIGDKAFFDCTNLTKIHFVDGLTTIGEQAFRYCNSLTGIELPDGITRIGESAFRDCNALETICIPKGVTVIEDYAFMNCQLLTSVVLSEGVSSIEKLAFYYCYNLKEVQILNGLTDIKTGAFSRCGNLETIQLPDSVAKIEQSAFNDCKSLKDVYYSGTQQQWEKIEIDERGNEALKTAEIHVKEETYVTGDYEYRILTDGTIAITKYMGADTTADIPKEIEGKQVTGIGAGAFDGCTRLTAVRIPAAVTGIGKNGFHLCSGLQDIYYSGTKEQWKQIQIDQEGNEALFLAVVHCTDDQPDQPPEETVQPETVDAKEELGRLKSGDPFSLAQDFKHYLSEEQIDIAETCLYTWLAEINFAYKYSADSGIKERIMKKAGIDPQGDFASGTEQAVTHISAETAYGPKTFEITLNLGQPDSGGNLYPAYGAMEYTILEKGNLPSDLPKSGQIGNAPYTDLGAFAACISKAAEDSLHHTYQWQSLDQEMAAGILIDKTATEIIGNKNGSFSDGTFTIYAKPLFTYSKKVTISCPVDVYVYNMDGTQAGAIIENQPSGGSQHVHLDVNGDTKTVYLAGNDYYLNLKGTDTGTMKYEVEEIANEQVRRNVQFLELQLKKDMQYEGYVFRPLNIDRDLYALRTVSGSGKEVIYADTDSYQPTFKRVQELSLSQKNTLLDADHKVQLSASLYPLDASNPELKWTTDNASIVNVDDSGLVTAVGAGRATVSVSTKDGSFLKQFCVIDVAEKKGSGSDENGNENNSENNNENESGTGSGSSRPENNGTNQQPNGSGSNSGSTGSSSGGTEPIAEQEKVPVVVKLHYVLQFQANGGTNLSRRTMTLLADDSPGIMPKVQRKDYTFDGWYTKQEGGTRIAGDMPLKEAATLYAQWTKVQAPAKAAAPVLKSKKKGQMQVRFQKVKNAAGYEIAYSVSKNFTSAKTKTIGAAGETAAIAGLKAGKKYYVRVRAYGLDSMRNKIYGAYSMGKSVQVQK